MRKLFAALAAVFAAMKTVTEKVWHAASGTFRVVTKTILAPVAAFGDAIFGGGRGHEPEGPSETEIKKLATDARAAGEREQAQRSALDMLATAVSRVARAMRDGREPEIDDAGLLAPCHLRYLQALRKDELEVLASPTASARKACKAVVSADDVVGLPSRDEATKRLEAKPVSAAEYCFRKRVDAFRAKRMGLAEDLSEEVVNKACGQTLCGLVDA
jgi:hypothetical protein